MAATHGRGDAGTASRILDVAEQMVQHRGFNGFSYADVAAELKITRSALHYHFASKAELGDALIARYAARFSQELAVVDTTTTAAPAKLDRYAGLYLDVLRHGRMCLCGMLAAEYQTLTQPMQISVISFFDQNETWLEGVLDQGRNEGSLQFAGSARDAGRMIISCLEGALLVARPHGDTGRFQAAAAHLLASLRPAQGAAVPAGSDHSNAAPASRAGRFRPA